MKLLSFVLVPHRESCGDGVCRVLKELTFHNDRGDTEDVIIIAFCCEQKDDIEALVYNIMYLAIQKPATDNNVETAAWSSWCTTLLLDNPYGRLISEYVAKAINTSCRLNIPRSEMLYLSSADGDWNLFKESVRQRML